MEPVYLVFILFPIVFVGFWVLVTLFLWRASGWASLQDEYPDRPDDQPHLTLRAQSGSMGYFPLGGVQFGNCLRLEACETGLRISVWKLLSPRSKPIFVPWTRISAEVTHTWFFRFVRLKFGNPEKGRLAIRPRVAKKLADGSRGQLALPG